MDPSDQGFLAGAPRGSGVSFRKTPPPGAFGISGQLAVLGVRDRVLLLAVGHGSCVPIYGRLLSRSDAVDVVPIDWLDMVDQMHTRPHDGRR